MKIEYNFLPYLFRVDPQDNGSLLQISLKKIAVPLGLFSLFLVYFIFGTGWYEPSQLVIRGKVLSGQGTLVVRWDSGAGYNGYERHKFVLGTALPKGQGKHALSIRRLGKSYPASLSADIFISKIIVDGQDLDLQKISQQQKFDWDGASLRLSEKRPVLDLEVHADEAIRVEVQSNNNSGKVEISLNGARRERDLYTANASETWISFEHWVLQESGEFTVRMEVPRYSLKKLLFRNDERKGNIAVNSIVLENGAHQTTLFTGGGVKFDQVEVPARNIVDKQYFNTTQNALQLVFAVLSTWIALSLLRLYTSCGGVTGIFSGKRKVFWLFFAGALITYSLWVFLFWPGVTSIDSLKIWRAAVLPDVFLNDHPLLNIFLYKYLFHLWSNMAVVPLFHVFILTLLVATIFYSLYIQNLSLYLLFPFYLLLILSIPIGLYNTVLWKDIPFAILIVFWAYTLVDLYRQKKDGCYHLSFEKMIALFLLLLAVGFIRHNGMLYFVVIPFCFVILGLVDLKRVAIIAITGFLLLSLLLIGLKLGNRIPDAGYFFIQAKSFLDNMFDTSIVKLLFRSWDNYWGILDINQTNSKWDLWHFYLKDRFAYIFLVHAQWNDVYPYLRQDYGPALTFFRKVAMAIYWKSYTVPWVYISWNPLYVLLLFPLTLLFFRRFPLSAVFSFIILAQVFVLISVINVLNWRYYYFVCLAGYFLVPLILLDLQRRKPATHNLLIG